MKLGQLLEYKKRKTFLQKSCRKWGRETSFKPVFFFSKKKKWSAAYFQYILIALYLAYNKNKLCKILDCWSSDTLNVDFLDLIILCMIFLMLNSILCYILLTDQVSLFDCLVISIVCFPSCDIINFEINLIFLTKPSFYTGPKCQDKNLNISRTKSAF